jgi:hypothetical protein
MQPLSGWSYADYERALSDTIDRAARLETQARKVCRAAAFGHTDARDVEIARLTQLLAELTDEAQSMLDARRAEFAAAGGAAC